MNTSDRPAGRPWGNATVKAATALAPPAVLAAAGTAAGSLGAIEPAVRSWLVLAMLATALGAAFVLALNQLGRIQAPGCTEGGDCAQLTGSRWGKVLGWPVSFLGTAWFASLVALHVAAWSPLVPSLLLAAVSAGAIGSLFFLGIIVRFRHLCPYCLMVHSANLAAWLLLATAPAYTWPTARTAIDAASGAAVFAAATALLAWTRTRTKQSSARQRERRFRQSLRRIHQHLHHSPEHHLRQPVGGRWWCGPTTAEIRLVVYLDYQCPDCRLAERQLEQALSGRCNVAVTYRHFPLSRQCNPRVHSSNDHRYACRAARAAEAAGLLGGNQGFLRLHAWLFHETVEFSDAKLAESLPRLGFDDSAAFFATMNGPDVARNVRQDIEEGARLGVVGTPAVFVEGIRLEGATAEQALPRLLDSLLGEREPRTRNANGRQETYRP